VAPFEISVAAYPECHPQSTDAVSDLDHLKRKVDAGASRAITQFFFDPDAFLRFRDRAVAAGIRVPLVPGILPVTNFAKAVEFAGSCNASIPTWFRHQFDGLDADPVTRQIVAGAVAVDLCNRLIDEGVDQLHFYSLNRSELVVGICHMLGVRALGAPSASAAA
jgi:methylenetetrahydrofolate reductase (NADPH)